MPTATRSQPPFRLLLTVATALAVAFAAANVDAQGRGMGKPSGGGGGKPGWSGGGGGGNWSGGNRGGNHGHWQGGNHGNWHGGNHGHWRGGGHGYWRGGYGYPYWRGYYGGRYYYPGWALGLGVGIGLTYPWWGWYGGYPAYGYPAYGYPAYGYPATTVVSERVYDAPVGVVVEREGPAGSQAPAANPVPALEPRWYCPTPAGYHPEIAECPAGWLKVLPNGGPPPAGTPRSSSPTDDVDRAGRIAPGTMGSASTTRIAAPRMAAPTQVAQRSQPLQALAQADTR